MDQHTRRMFARLPMLALPALLATASGCASSAGEERAALESRYDHAFGVVTGEGFATDMNDEEAPAPLDATFAAFGAGPQIDLQDRTAPSSHQRPLDGWRPRVVSAPRQQDETGGVSVYGDLPGNLGRIAEQRADGQTVNLEHVSFAREGSDFDPVINRDGSTLFYASTQHSPTADIYRKQVTGSAITQLTSHPANDVMPAISPDGSRIAFASDRNGSWDLFLMSSDGGQAAQLTLDGSNNLHPTWSPDGRMIAFCRLGEVSGKWELWVVEANNPGARTFLGYGLFPEWSPVDDKIAFQRSRDRGDRFFSVWTIDFEEGEARNPTEIASDPDAAIVNPTWSPDGRHLAFAVIPDPAAVSNGRTPPQSDIWIARVDGSGRANLTGGGGFANLSPSWTSGDAVFFVSNRSGKDNIWAVRPLQAIVAGSRSAEQNIAGARGEPGSQRSDWGLVEVDPQR